MNRHKIIRTGLIGLSLFLISSSVFAGFLGQFSKCKWIIKGSENSQGYYYLCDNDYQSAPAALWASKANCKGHMVMNPGDYNEYFCRAGTWKFNSRNYPPCSCTAN